MKHGTDVNASGGIDGCPRDELCDRDSWNLPLRRAPVAVTLPYVRVISRPYRGRFTTAPGPRSVLGTSRSYHRKARKSPCDFTVLRSSISHLRDCFPGNLTMARGGVCRSPDDSSPRVSYRSYNSNCNRKS